MNAVEHIGSGIKRIKKACSDYGFVFFLTFVYYLLMFIKNVHN